MGSLPTRAWEQESAQWADQLTYSQAQIQSFVLACWSALRGWSYRSKTNRISMTQGNKQDVWQESQKSSSIDIVAEGRQTSHCNKHLQTKKYGQKGIVWDTLWHTTTSTMRCFLCFRVFACFVCVLQSSFLLGGGLQEQRQIWGDWEKSETTVHDMKITKNQ